MAAKGAQVMEKLRDETECCICTETFVDPRVLPCLHTFCLKCLQTNVTALNRRPRQLMPCPVCRTEFNIPDSGLAGLQKNFVVERLIDIVKTPNPSTIESPGIPCEACLEEADPWLSTTVPPAGFYCADCQQRLCDECSTHHRKNKMTKLHTVSRLMDESNDRCLLKNCVMRYCPEHRSDILVYCLDCMHDFCPRCSGHLHKLHRSSTRGEIIDEYSKLVDLKVYEFMDVKLHVQEVQAEVVKEKDAIFKKMDFLEGLVTERSDKIKKLVDSHAKLLQEEIRSRKEKHLENIKLQKEKLDKLQDSLLSYCEDCSDRKEFATIEAVILAMDSIKAKAEELTLLHQACANYPASNLVEVALRESDFDEFLGKSNVIGQIEVVEKEAKVDIMSSSLCDQPAKMNPEPVSSSSGDKDNLQEYAQNPKLIHTIKTRASTDDSKVITGIAVLDDDLFIVHEESPKLCIYDASSFIYLIDLDICELDDPCDIVSCRSNQCLYIFDRDYDNEPYRIFRLDSGGHIIRKWITGNSYGTISVTYDSNIIVAFSDRSVLKEYSDNGRLLRELVIRNEEVVNGLLHARKLHSGLFLIAYKGALNDHSLSLVDVNGDVLKSVSETEGPGVSLNDPCFFALDGEESILLVDRQNRRVLLFSADLERSVELATRHKGLHYPRRVCLDESTGRMFVVDNWLDYKDNTYRNGRVLVFQVKNV